MEHAYPRTPLTENENTPASIGMACGASPVSAMRRADRPPIGFRSGGCTQAGPAIPARFALAFAIAVSAWLAVCIAAPSYAEEIDTNPEADEFQLEVERTAAAYDAAIERVEAASRDLDENRARITELEGTIPDQEARSGAAAREQYKLCQQGSGVLDLLLGADSFHDFLASLEYVNRISQANLDEMNRLTDMKAELDAAQDALKLAKREADENAEEASAALAAAQEARQEAQRRAREEARRQAEQAAAEAARAQAEAESEARNQAEAAEAESPASPEKPSDAPSQPAQTEEEENDGEGGAPQEAEAAVGAPSDDGADWSADQTSFVDEWSGRIDAYLAGSPMAGLGRSFAVAAWNYGVDPRWSPAIACVESTKGAACFHPFNAWGWGSASWQSWDAAIDEHVRGLARGYGYTLSIDAAKKYCPPNWQHWYDATLAQMNLI